MKNENSQALIIDSSRDIKLIRALASEARINILTLLQNQELNVSEIAKRLSIPQSSATTSISILENAGLITSRIANGVKGGQKICGSRYKEILINFTSLVKDEANNTIEMEMPVGLFTSYDVSAPCGLCSRESIIGYPDVPVYFFSPDRIKAALIWFERGYVEYKFPNNALYVDKALTKLELIMELSSEVPGTNKKWPSDISVCINEIEVGNWTSPGDFSGQRGRYTPSFWKLEGSQYGFLTTWAVSAEGTFINGECVSDTTLEDLHIPEHHSIKVRIGVKDDAEHVGGINIFGKGFGNYDQDILIRLYFDERSASPP